MPSSVTVRYFAMLREQAGVDCEKIETSAADCAALYSELKARHGFALDAKHLRVALADEFVDMNCKLEDGSVVTFVPPVAGG